MNEREPYVSVIIPCLNEERFIRKCLESVVANDYPKDRLEVLVVDGMSKDGTRMIIDEFVRQNPFIKLLENPKKITPIAMNIGIKSADGEIIMKMDAHTKYDSDYISKCVRYLYEFKADNVGGILKMLPAENTYFAQGIVFSLSHPFGVGNSYFRIGSRRPKWVDTVSFGCYRKQVFEKIGLYDENLVRGQDMDLNLRLKRAGGKALLHPEIIGHYYAKPNLMVFVKHNWNNGLWAILPFLYTKGMPVSLRHVVPIAFVATLIISGILGLVMRPFLWLFLGIIVTYIFANLSASSEITWRERDLRYIAVMPLIFVLLHVSYGLGSLWGSMKLLTTPGFWKKLMGKYGVHSKIPE